MDRVLVQPDQAPLQHRNAQSGRFRTTPHPIRSQPLTPNLGCPAMGGSSAGPTSRSAPPPRSAATKPWSTARSRSAGTPGSTHPPPTTEHLLALRNRRSTAPQRGGPAAETPAEYPSWPKALRAVRAWLTPWLLLQRWWHAWTHEPPPEQLQQLLNALERGHAINQYLPP